MKEISEIDLHLYTLNRSLLDKETAEEIESRIQTDFQLAAELKEIAEFYNIYENLETASSEKTFLLTPLVLKSNKQENISLAAQQSVQIEPKLKYVRTFISAERYVMVRMFHNLQTGEYEFYVVCEDNENSKKALIKIPSLNREIRVDESGMAKFTAEYIPEDIELTVTLQ